MHPSPSLGASVEPCRFQFTSIFPFQPPAPCMPRPSTRYRNINLDFLVSCHNDIRAMYLLSMAAQQTTSKQQKHLLFHTVLVDQQWQWFSVCFCPMRLQLKWQQSSAIFSSEGQVTNIVSFVGHTVCVATTQLCCEGAKAATDNTCTNGFGCTPRQLYLQKQVASWLAWGVGWPIPDPKV